ncbi:hypothetical protein [Chitinophaga qingshengii]|uniref:Uncharacterized protein n=1 Tax=Chitinophaga qingshengii TaxID=1569794 RepID=A0ABR7TS57_9BACT|nr:hypothetical protein [Chitinophaga qingshengii]MBC9933320.1 hypothetical protein [Chitinophaga qingshengii]
MLPQIINNFVFEKSYINDLVTLVSPNKKITNIIPYSFTRTFNKAGLQSLEERRWYLYYGYFLVSKNGDTPQTVTFTNDSMIVVKWENFSYEVDQFLILANAITLQNPVPDVYVHFVGYRIQIEDTGKMPDFYVPSQPPEPQTVQLMLHNRTGVQLAVYVNNYRVPNTSPNSDWDIGIRILRGPTSIRFSPSVVPGVPVPDNTFLESREAAAGEGVSIPYTSFDQVFNFDSSQDVERHVTLYRNTVEPLREIVVNAYLTDQDDIYNSTVVEFTLPYQFDFDVTFKIARCVTNTSAGLNYCYGVQPGSGSGDPDAIVDVTIPRGTGTHRISLQPSPGKAFGYVERIEISAIGDARVTFIKFPGSSWILVLK